MSTVLGFIIHAVKAGDLLGKGTKKVPTSSCPGGLALPHHSSPEPGCTPVPSKGRVLAPHNPPGLSWTRTGLSCPGLGIKLTPSPGDEWAAIHSPTAGSPGSLTLPHTSGHTSPPFPGMSQKDQEPADAIFHVRANTPFLVHKQECEFSPHLTASSGDTHVT